jgi:hypothetical protein
MLSEMPTSYLSLGLCRIIFLKNEISFHKLSFASLSSAFTTHAPLGKSNYDEA